jgi:phenylacetate-CoA ligase
MKKLINESLPTIAQLRRMTQNERQRYLNERLKALVSFAYKSAPAIKTRLDQAGINPHEVRSIDDLQALPVLRKDNLIELYEVHPPFGDLVTKSLQTIGRVYISPGPIYDPHHQSKYYWHRHMQLMKDVGFHKRDIVINAWSYHLVPAGLLIDESLRRVGVTVVPMGTGNTELQVQVMKHLQVTGFFGAATFFMNIVSKAEEMGYDVRKDFSLRTACIGGEMGGGPIRKLVEEKYGIYTADIYGTADIGLMAYECRQKSGLHIAENVIVEVVDPETGKPVASDVAGELVVTPIDETYPLLRFGTGDLVSWINEPCSCGNTSLKITRILGRIGDAVRTRGMFIHPKQLESALVQFIEIAKYQAVVTREGYRDMLILKVELKDNTELDKEWLTKNLITAVTESVRIKLDRIDYVIKGTIPEEHKLIVDKRVY